jgi:hypothetical protein
MGASGIMERAIFDAVKSLDRMQVMTPSGLSTHSEKFVRREADQ